MLFKINQQANRATPVSPICDGNKRRFRLHASISKRAASQNPNRAREIYERLNTYLFPHGDILCAIADAILIENNIDENTKFEFVMDVNGKIERKYNQVNSSTDTDNVLDLKIKSEMQRNIEKIFQPMLENTAYRGCAKNI